MPALVDIIIPVYNTPQKDLELCFDSIVNQTFSNWRLCIIDDGSNSETALYLDSWMTIDKRIEVYHYKNGGPPVARNHGLDLVTASYFTLVDSDDILSPDFLEHSYNECVSHGLDMMIGSIACVDDNNKLLVECKPKFETDNETKIYSGNEVNQLLDYSIATYANINNSELKGMLLARLYPKLVNTNSFCKYSIRFENGMFNHDDNIFSFDCFLNFHKVGITTHKYYEYIEHTYSIVHRKASLKIYKEEVEYLRALKKREGLFVAAGCEAALTTRYLMLFVIALTVAFSCEELDYYQAYEELDRLICLSQMAKSIQPKRYPLSKRYLLVYYLLKVKNKTLQRKIIHDALLVINKIEGAKN